MERDQIIGSETRPRLARGVRLHEDRVRGRTVLLAPERVITLSQSAIDVLSRCDGQCTLDAVAADLAQIYRAERRRIAADVRALLSALADRRMVEL